MCGRAGSGVFLVCALYLPRCNGHGDLNVPILRMDGLTPSVLISPSSLTYHHHLPRNPSPVPLPTSYTQRYDKYNHSPGPRRQGLTSGAILAQ